MLAVATPVIWLARGTGRRAALLRVLLMLLLSFAAHDAVASDLDGKWAATLYAARISSEAGWEDVFINPIGADYVDAFLAGRTARGQCHCAFITVLSRTG
jgi:hypothetical protein